MSADPDTSTTACYRHPNRPAALGCSRCGRPICLDDAVDAPVGYLCPECARVPRRQVRASRAAAATLTKVLVGANLLLFVLQQVPSAPFGGALTRDLILFGPAVAAGEWWRVVTGGFLHGSVIHVGFNAYLLWLLGNMLEPETGSGRFGAVYAAGLFGGAGGALLLSWGSPVLGASGAVFGLMGAAMVGMRRRGINPWRSSIGTLVILNLVFTFAAPNISIGGHLGGFAGGALAALPLFQAQLPTRSARQGAAWGIAAAVGGLAVLLGVAGPVL